MECTISLVSIRSTSLRGAPFKMTSKISTCLDPLTSELVCGEMMHAQREYAEAAFLKKC
jgi:hypothetical protein